MKSSNLWYKVKKMNGNISRIGFVASMLSVVGSLYVYFVTGDENLGIFVGLWAPTLILASKEIETMLEK
jgi:hypothetical protein